MRHFFTILTLFFASIAPSSGDYGAYADRVKIWAESEALLVLHNHDWSDSKKIADAFDPLRDEEVHFHSKNQFAYVKVLSKENGEVLWNSPSPAFSHLWVSPDSNYVIGLSNIKINNPYQLVIFDRSGKVLYKHHVTSSKAEFTQNELEDFLFKYPATKKILLTGRLIHDGRSYIDFARMGMPVAIPEKAWEELKNRSKPDPFVPWVIESVTNSVRWFDESEPNLAIVEEDSKRFLMIDSIYGPPASEDNLSKMRIKIEIPRSE
ncbi:hypothetical protein FEM03_01040 [Phragmitibacter flavus]|uniref:Uncharacterized protein n=1 Tax=Phragmitibacter flavus TaxID=2576071 RepID=A0A5R8KKD2_9BACT|nr:hypothetical protein [Phragmitibacter flavus]TLD72691.1 hypothetical protein FEM03_01040 [Phragmitibacter flavus]